MKDPDQRRKWRGVGGGRKEERDMKEFVNGKWRMESLMYVPSRGKNIRNERETDFPQMPDLQKTDNVEFS